MKSTEFFDWLSAHTGLKPGTCRNYLRLADFKPAAIMPGRQRIEHVWEKEQLESAVKAIRDFQKKRAA